MGLVKTRSFENGRDPHPLTIYMYVFVPCVKGASNGMYVMGSEDGPHPFEQEVPR